MENASESTFDISSSEEDDLKQKEEKEMTLDDKKKYYECYICEKRLSSKRNVNLHITSDHEEKKPVKCDKCQANFAEKSKMSAHVLSVHEGKENDCSICSARFSWKEHLKKYIKVLRTKTTACH